MTTYLCGEFHEELLPEFGTLDARAVGTEHVRAALTVTGAGEAWASLRPEVVATLSNEALADLVDAHLNLAEVTPTVSPVRWMIGDTVYVPQVRGGHLSWMLLQLLPTLGQEREAWKTMAGLF